MRILLVLGSVLVFLAIACPPAGAQPAAEQPKEAKTTESAKNQKQPAKDLRALRLDHSRLRNELLAVESRLSLLSEKVFSSRLEVRFAGDLERPFSLARVELYLDGSLAYRQEFANAPAVQALKLFDGYLLPGQHQLALHLWARSPGELQTARGGFFSGSGMVVLMREKSDTLVVFEADQDGDALNSGALADSEPDGSWNVEVEAHYETQKRN